MSLIFRRTHRLLNCVQACNINSIAYYSRKNRPRDADSRFDVLTNWQYYEAKDKRFYLPGELGPSWQVQRNVKDVCLTEVVDYFNFSTKRLHIKVYNCPILLRSEVQNMFPSYTNDSPDMTIIKLSYKHFNDDEKGHKFVHLASKVICHRLMVQGYWADFPNIYTGKAEYDLGKETRHDRDPNTSMFCGTLDASDVCIYIKEKAERGKHSMVYTNVPRMLVDRFIYDL